MKPKNDARGSGRISARISTVGPTCLPRPPEQIAESLSLGTRSTEHGQLSLTPRTEGEKGREVPTLRHRVEPHTSHPLATRLPEGPVNRRKLSFFHTAGVMTGCPEDSGRHTV